MENLGLLKRSGDLPLHGQCLIPSTARLALGSGPGILFCTISPTPKRLYPWTLTLGKGEGSFGKVLGEGLNFRSLRKGRAGGWAPASPGTALFLLVSLPKSKQHRSIRNPGRGNMKSSLAGLFSGDEPLDELLNCGMRTFLVRKNSILPEEPRASEWQTIGKEPARCLSG